MKLSIPNLVEEKVLYVDGDTIFKDCPQRLSNDLEDNVLGESVTILFSTTSKEMGAETIPFENANEMYINSGLLLWNLKAPEKNY